MSNQSTTPVTQAEPNHLWSADDVAAYLRTSRSWVYKAAADGTLPSVRIGSVLRFLPASVEALVNTQHTPKGGTP